MNVLVKMLNPREVETLKNEFMKIDTDNSGMIEISELQKAILESKVNLTEAQVKQIIDELDYNGNGIINYSEFIMATISVHNFLTH